MKHLILITSFILSSVITFGQWIDQGATIYTADRIQQTTKIYLPFSTGNNYIRAASTSNYTFFDSQAGVGIGHQAVTSYPFSVYGMTFLYGDVRIGGNSIYNGLPSARLHVYGNAGSLLLEGTDHVFMSFYPSGYAAGSKAYFGFHSVSTSDITLTNEISGGDVVISTTGGGDINLIASVWAKEVLVQAIDPWPDFVFANDYKLNSLTQLEEYITKNNHLPDVPSSKEIEENGINLGEMDAILLQKIEEMTLYIISQQKQIEEQGKLIESLIQTKK